MSWIWLRVVFEIIPFGLCFSLSLNLCRFEFGLMGWKMSVKYLLIDLDFMRSLN